MILTTSQLAEQGVDVLVDLGPNYEHSVFEKLKQLWVSNGNELSIQYSGTGTERPAYWVESTASAITKGGKQGIFGSLSSGLKSLNRFFINTFGDDFRQQCIDIFLNREATASMR